MALQLRGRIGERVVGIYPGSDIAMEVCDALNNERNRR
jgi:hypothetical protein